MKTKILTIAIAAFLFYTGLSSTLLFAQQIAFADEFIKNESGKKKEIRTIKNCVFFNYDRTELTPQAIPVLDQIVDTLKKYPRYTIEIYGHTDSIGSRPFNMKLSKKRTGTVAQYLLSNGIEEKKINTKSFGKTRPIAANHTDQGRAKNRRVELSIKYEVENEEPVIYTSSDNIFYINNDKDAVLLGEKGTSVTIPANSFITANGNKVPDSVKVELKEVFTKKDMILSGLTTVDTEGNLLESGGMFYIDPTINGQRLKLKEGQYIDVEIPADEIKEGMQLYKISHSKWRLLKSGNIATDYKNKKYKVKINKGFGFGWFNCDRYFRSRDYKLRDYKLIVKKKNNNPSFFIHTNTIPAGYTNPKLSGLSLFFNDKNSSMNSTAIKNKKIEFGNLYAGDHITLVGIGYLLKSKNEKEHFNQSLEDQIPIYAIKEHEIKKNIFHRNKIKNLEFKQMTSDQLDKALASL